MRSTEANRERLLPTLATVEDIHGYDMTSDRLTLRWGGDDGDGIGKLTVVAWANGFAGVGAAWFDRATVLQFAESVAAYPLPDRPIELAGGFGESFGRPPREHVRLSVAPVGLRGQVGLRVHLATEQWPDTRVEAVHDVRLELLTTYERLRDLSGDLGAVIEGRLDHAEIGGEVLA